MNALVQSYDAEIEEVLAYHGGDVRAAIEALL
ncbi:CUE domain-containing protein, partial [Brucella intermedia]